MVHDPEAEKSIVIVFFDNEDDYARGDAAPERDAGRRDPRDAHGGRQLRGRGAGNFLRR
jgi:hypothetical protein